MQQQVHHDPEIGGYHPTNGGDHKASGGITPTFVLVICGFLFLFPYVSIPILWSYQPWNAKSSSSASSTVAMTAAISPTGVSTTPGNGIASALSSWGSGTLVASAVATPAGGLLQPAAIASAATASTVGTPVSISATGSLQAGGGTSIYRGVGILPAVLCPKYLDITPVFTNTYLLTYTASTQLSATVSVVRYSSKTKKATNITTTVTTNNLFQTVTLNANAGLFASITQYNTIVAGQVAQATGKVTFGTPTTFVSGFSAVPQITPLSTTTFATAYYNASYGPAPNYNTIYSFVSTRIGTVNPTSLAVTLGPPINIIPNSGGTVNGLSIVAVSPTLYLAVWTDNACTACQAYSTGEVGQLNAMLLTVAGTGASAKVTAGAVVSSPLLAFGFTDVDALVNHNFVVTYTDPASNYGQSLVVIDVDAALTPPALYFGAEAQVTTGVTQTGVGPYSTVTNLGTSIATLGGGSEVAVMFSDVNNNGAFTAAVFKLTPSTELVRASPNFVLNTGFVNGDIESYSAWGSIAVGSHSQYGTQAAFVSAIQINSDTKCSVPAVADVSIMEILPKPVGVLASGSTLALSGAVTGYSNLQVGKMYYATTGGSLVADSNGYYGSDGLLSNAASNEINFVYDAKQDVIVTMDSQVGLAVSSDTILLNLL